MINILMAIYLNIITDIKMCVIIILSINQNIRQNHKHKKKNIKYRQNIYKITFKIKTETNHVIKKEHIIKTIQHQQQKFHVIHIIHIHHQHHIHLHKTHQIQIHSHNHHIIIIHLLIHIHIHIQLVVFLFMEMLQ